ncbi:hypothetical protein [Actinocrispum wychmicini]|uniref:Uncharacterized protein n=1 Tax=Actinocrispum wychmicini TaxID=1213861 RepID=A0A4R2JQ31_9PSEU|nr:hypothetical protein [Actinocrispum wychmicini]TCO59286.1 hypothetical protein EV192_104127 [Actinocrispum wychmicini]
MTATPSLDDSAGEDTRRSVLATATEVLTSPGRLVGFAVAAVVTGVAYTILLPFGYTQRFSTANWAYLTPAMIAWSVILGLGMAFVLVVQIYAIRQVAAGRSAVTAGWLAVLGSLLPSLLCCSPVLPTLLAFVGLSTAQVYGTTGAWQYFFATHQTEFLAGSLAVLVATAWWGLRRIARSTCLSAQGCPTTDNDAAGDAEPYETAATDQDGQPR